jgi:hypothetical protein
MIKKERSYHKITYEITSRYVVNIVKTTTKQDLTGLKSLKTQIGYNITIQSH